MRKTVARVLQAAGVTTILVTHDQEEALSFADRLVGDARGQGGAGGYAAGPLFPPERPRDGSLHGGCGSSASHCQGNMANCALGNVPIAGEHKGKVEIMLRPRADPHCHRWQPAGQYRPSGRCGICRCDLHHRGCAERRALPPIRIKTSSVALPLRRLCRLDVAEKAHVLEG